MPGINDHPDQVHPIVERAKKADATFLGGVALHLRDEVKDVFFAWLEAKRPDLLPRYEQLYKGRAYMQPRAAQADHPRRPRLGEGSSRPCDTGPSPAVPSPDTSRAAPQPPRPGRRSSATSPARGAAASERLTPSSSCSNMHSRRSLSSLNR